jgi:hypothetical protein
MTVPHCDTEATLDVLFRDYARSGDPIQVNFRELIPGLTNGERATHFAHPYPAKLLRHIPYIFAQTNRLSRPGDLILDPFCGSGTALLEAILCGRNAIGADSNPLARLISRSKTVSSPPETIRRRAVSLLARAQRTTGQATTIDVVNVDLWFYPHVQRQLSALKSAIDDERNDHIRSFFRMALSATIKRVSLADPRLSVPVRLRASQYGEDHWLRAKTETRLRRLKRVNVTREFETVLESNLRRMEDFRRIRVPGVSADVIACDARDLRQSGCRRSVATGSVDLIITSPPYPGAQKYIRSSSLSLGWLGLATSADLRPLETANVGREHYRKSDYKQFISTGVSEADRVLADLRRIDPLRAHIAAQYLIEMRSAVTEMARVLKPGGHAVLVSGTNKMRGSVFDTPSYLETIMLQCGFITTLRLVDGIRSRGLMTKRNRTADVIWHEWVTVATKL